MNRRDVLKGLFGAGAAAVLPWPIAAAVANATDVALPFIPATKAVADGDSFIPELWAQEALTILNENLVIGNLIHRDLDYSIAKYGDVVNIRRPGTFQIAHKGTRAKPMNVAVQLDQWFYNSFTIKDGETNQSFSELSRKYLLPSMAAMAHSIDDTIFGCAHDGIQGRPVAHSVIDARQKLNVNKAGVMNRNLIVTPTCKVKVGSDGHGRTLGFDTFDFQDVHDGLAFHRDAVALVTRPINTPSTIGVLSHVANHNDISMRVVMQYDCYRQGIVFNFDVLAGTALLDPSMCVALRK